MSPLLKGFPKKNPSFPDSLNKLIYTGKHIRGAGGGVFVLEDENEQVFVLKMGLDIDQLKAEIITDGLYRAVGVLVPDFAVYDEIGENLAQQLGLSSKHLCRLTPFIPSDKDTSDMKASVMKEISKHYLLDVLLRNNDIHFGNCLRDLSGQLWRIDNGKNILVEPKRHPNTVWEFLKFRGNSKVAQLASKAYKQLKQEEIQNQLDALIQTSETLIEAARRLQKALGFSVQEDIGDLLINRICFLIEHFSTNYLAHPNSYTPAQEGYTQAGILVLTPKAGGYAVLLRQTLGAWDVLAGNSSARDRHLSDTALRQLHEQTEGIWKHDKLSLTHSVFYDFPTDHGKFRLYFLVIKEQLAAKTTSIDPLIAWHPFESLVSSDSSFMLLPFLEACLRVLNLNEKILPLTSEVKRLSTHFPMINNPKNPPHLISLYSHVIEQNKPSLISRFNLFSSDVLSSFSNLLSNGKNDLITTKALLSKYIKEGNTTSLDILLRKNTGISLNTTYNHSCRFINLLMDASKEVLSVWFYYLQKTGRLRSISFVKTEKKITFLHLMARQQLNKEVELVLEDETITLNVINQMLEETYQYANFELHYSLKEKYPQSTFILSKETYISLVNHIARNGTINTLKHFKKEPIPFKKLQCRFGSCQTPFDLLAMAIFYRRKELITYLKDTFKPEINYLFFAIQSGEKTILGLVLELYKTHHHNVTSDLLTTSTESMHDTENICSLVDLAIYKGEEITSLLFDYMGQIAIEKIETGARYQNISFLKQIAENSGKTELKLEFFIKYFHLIEADALELIARTLRIKANHPISKEEICTELRKYTYWQDLIDAAPFSVTLFNLPASELALMSFTFEQYCKILYNCITEENEAVLDWLFEKTELDASTPQKQDLLFNYLLLAYQQPFTKRKPLETPIRERLEKAISKLACINTNKYLVQLKTTVVTIFSKTAQQIKIDAPILFLLDLMKKLNEYNAYYCLLDLITTASKTRHPSMLDTLLTLLMKQYSPTTLGLTTLYKLAITAAPKGRHALYIYNYFLKKLDDDALQQPTLKLLLEAVYVLKNYAQTAPETYGFLRQQYNGFLRRMLSLCWDIADYEGSLTIIQILEDKVLLEAYQNAHPICKNYLSVCIQLKANDLYQLHHNDQLLSLAEAINNCILYNNTDLLADIIKNHAHSSLDSFLLVAAKNDNRLAFDLLLSHAKNPDPSLADFVYLGDKGKYYVLALLSKLGKVESNALEAAHNLGEVDLIERFKNLLEPATLFGTFYHK